MKRSQLLAILLGMCFFTVAVSAYGDELQPQIDAIDIYEAVRVAEELLLSEEVYYMQNYKNQKLAISIVEKHYTQCNFILFSSETCVCENMQADKFVQLYSLGAYSKKIFERLEGRIYWIVYFIPIPDPDPSKMMTGGDIAFFIDAETSELIDVYRGQ